MEREGGAASPAWREFGLIARGAGWTCESTSIVAPYTPLLVGTGRRKVVSAQDKRSSQPALLFQKPHDKSRGGYRYEDNHDEKARLSKSVHGAADSTSDRILHQPRRSTAALRRIQTEECSHEHVGLLPKGSELIRCSTLSRQPLSLANRLSLGPQSTRNP
jgi:hypothetical protein